MERSFQGEAKAGHAFVKGTQTPATPICRVLWKTPRQVKVQYKENKKGSMRRTADKTRRTKPVIKRIHKKGLSRDQQEDARENKTLNAIPLKARTKIPRVVVVCPPPSQRLSGAHSVSSSSNSRDVPQGPPPPMDVVNNRGDTLACPSKKAARSKK